MIEIKKATSTQEFQLIEKIANEVFPKTYGHIVPLKHINSLLKDTQTKKAIKNQVLNKGYTYFIFEYDNETVGYYAVQQQKQNTFLSKFYILENFRGKKIGKYGLAHIYKFAQENKSNYIELFVNEENYIAIDIYAKNGFKIIESVVNSFPNGHLVNDYKMKKKVVY